MAHSARADFVFDHQRNIYVCPGGAELTSTGKVDQGHTVYYSHQESLLNLLPEAEVHDGGGAQDHPRPRQGCARSGPRLGQHGSLPAITPRTQKSGNAICAHEAHPPARPASTARPQVARRTGSLHTHTQEPEASRQALPPATAIGSGCLFSVAGASSDGADRRCCGSPQWRTAAKATD